MNRKRKVILVGDKAFFHQRLAAIFAERGLVVSSHDVFASPETIAREFVPPGTSLTVIFTPTEQNDFALAEQDLESGSGGVLAAAVGERLEAFLAQAQAALRQLLQAGGGQFWVCDYDDSFGYHYDGAASPLVAQARAAAVRSIAKEYSRMKVMANSLFVQPLADGVNNEKFKEAAPSLKTYAMRYKPHTVEDIAELLATFINSERIAFSGAMIGTGTGIQQGHLIA